MKKQPDYTGSQLSLLVILRIAIGWHFLYEGLTKIFNPGWSSVGYLLDSQGLFSGIFHAMAANPNVVAFVDFLNIWGLTAIGLGLVLGLLTQVATVAGIVVLAFYYLSHPALIGVDYAVPGEGNYFLVNKTLIELITLWVLYLFPTGYRIGIDRFFVKRKN
jgi:thiosulfate dehydrogenase [quinone] large subunit